MPVKKLKDLIPAFAQEKGIPLEVAEVVIMGIWNEGRIVLDEMKHLDVSMEGLGTFSMKYWRVPKMLEEHTRLFKNTSDHYGGKLRILADVKKLEYAQDMIDDRKRKKEAYWEIRKEYERNKLKNNGSTGETPENMEEQASDS